MKVTFINLTDRHLQSFELTKKVDNDFMVEEINSELVFDTRSDFDYLLNSVVSGEEKEDGELTFYCGIDEVTKDVHIKHNEGKFDIRKCVFNKPLHITNILDCVINETINIYDYTAATTDTIQGTLEKVQETITGTGYFAAEETITLEKIFAVIGNIPDKTSTGYYIEYIQVQAKPLFEDYWLNPITYQGHELAMVVSYARMRSSVQHSYLWKLIPGETDYFFSGFANVIPGNAERTLVADPVDGLLYEDLLSKSGKIDTYTDIPISNTYYINEIIEDIFTCTGLAVVSDFLGINPDSTAPVNDAYTFAGLYCQNIKIVQSFDVIREAALMDSFSVSGDIKTKDFLNGILKLFNLIIVSDSTTLRIEHKSYFISKGADLLFEQIDYEIGDIEINKEQIDAEEFSYAQPTPTENFYLTRIEYDRVNLYAEENVKQYKIENFITDVFGTINNEDYNKDEYKSLFYLLSTENNEIIGLNSQFAMLEIFNNLHTIIRPCKRAKVNGVETLFDTYSIGLETTIKIDGTISRFNTLFPFYTVKINEGVFLISEIRFTDQDEIELKVIK